jgi:response regulator RpfG family c-di-GMP phosphodiesterase
MTKPLALLVYEELLPGTQLANRLTDLGYRVHTLAPAAANIADAEREGPLVVVLDLVSKTSDPCTLIRALKDNPGTAHLPVLAFGIVGRQRYRHRPSIAPTTGPDSGGRVVAPSRSVERAGIRRAQNYQNHADSR